MSKIALITGITGQDGSYLAEILLEKGYTVHGIKRRSSQFNTERIDHLYQDPHELNVRFHLHYGDLTDQMSITRLIKEAEPDEIYNLGAMSHVKVSFDIPEYTANADGMGLLRILESLKMLEMEERVKVFQASTSELFGNAEETPQSETTPFKPRSPYATAKLYGYWTAVNYREAYNMFVSNGIMFNHESPRRGETFVARKITRAVARIAHGIQDRLFLGNLDAERDWGHAKDYMEAAWQMLQMDLPTDLVIATGTSTSVRDFARMAFSEVGIEIAFQGSGTAEIAVVTGCSDESLRVNIGQPVVAIDPNYYRPNEVNKLVGDASKAGEMLGWKPSYNLQDIVSEMVAADLTFAAQEKRLGSRPPEN